MGKGVDVKPGRKRLIYTVCYSRGEFGGTRRRSAGMRPQITSAVLEKEETRALLMLALAGTQANGEFKAEIKENHL